MKAEELIELKKEWGSIFTLEITEIKFTWRPLTRQEYKSIISTMIDDADREQLICQSCILEPSHFNFEDCDAGIPTTLASAILDNSALDEKSIKRNMSKYKRYLEENFEPQMDLIIFEGFSGKYSLEEIKSWPMEKSVAMFVQAEWILKTLRGVPLEVNEDIPPELQDPNAG